MINIKLNFVIAVIIIQEINIVISLEFNVKPETLDESPFKLEYHQSRASQNHNKSQNDDIEKNKFYVNLSEKSQVGVKFISGNGRFLPDYKNSTQDSHSRHSEHFVLDHGIVQVLHKNEPKTSILFNTQEASQILMPIQKKLIQSQKKNVVVLQEQKQQHKRSSQQDINQSTILEPVGEQTIRYSQIASKNIHHTNSQVQQQQQHQRKYGDGITKLVSSTQNLISNDDVIEINSAIEYNSDEKSKKNFSANILKQNKDDIDCEDQFNIDKTLNKNKFITPIIVDDNSHGNFDSTAKNLPTYHTEIEITKPSREYLPRIQEQKQINVQIINDHNNGQFLKETTVNNKKNMKTYLNVTPFPHDKTIIYSTTKSTTQTTTKNISEQEKLVVTTRPISQKFLAPIQAGLRLSKEKIILDDCIDLKNDSTPVKNIKSQNEQNYHQHHHHHHHHHNPKTIVEVQKSLNIKNFLINKEGKHNVEFNKQQQHQTQHPVQQSKIFGARFEPKQPQIIQQPIIVEKPIEKIVDNYHIVEKKVPIPIYIDRFIEKKVPVQVNVEKRIPYPVEIPKYYEKQVPIHVEKIIAKPVPYPVEVEKIVEKHVPVDRIIEKKVPYEVQVEKKVLVEVPVEKIVDRPVHITHTQYIDRPYPIEKIVERKIHVPVDKIVEKIVDRPYAIEKKVPYPVTYEKIIEKPVEVEKIVNKFIDRPIPYPVEVKKYIDRPYPVEKVVEKIVDRPVEIEKIVEKQIPYPVERIVEKIIDHPVQVEKIIDNPIHIPYPVEVKKYIDRPYPVDRIVEKQVLVPFPVEKIVEKIVDRPVEVEKIVEKNVQIPVEVEKVVEKYIDRPYQVDKFIDRPYPVEKIVEKYIDRPVPYQVPVEVPVQVHIPVQVPVEVPVHIPYTIEKEVPVPYAYAVEIPYVVPIYQNIHKTISHNKNIPQPVIKKQQSHGFDGFNLKSLFGEHHVTRHVYLDDSSLSHILDPYRSHNTIKNINIKHENIGNYRLPKLFSHNRYGYGFPKSTILEPVGTQLTQNGQLKTSVTHTLQNPFQPSTKHFNVNINDNVGLSSNFNGNYAYQPIQLGYSNDYYGPAPLKINYWDTTNTKNGYKFRRGSEYGKNLRIEYGFKPPMVPSIEIDENGNPIERNHK